MSITEQQLKQILEAAIMASNEPLSIEKMLDLFAEEKEPPARDVIKDALGLIETECEARGVELKKVSSGYRFQAKKDFSPWVSRLWEEKPARYSRALLETMVLIAYKQPITRGEIEHVRGVAVSTNIIKTLLERDWVRVVGHRDVPGKPALYATTKAFLDYFNLTSLEELPTLAEIRDLDKINPELELQEPGSEQEEAAGETVSAEAMQQQVDAAVGEEVTNEIEQETEAVDEQVESVEALEEDIDTNQDDRDDVMLDEHDKEMESRLVAEEEELIAATESPESEEEFVAAIDSAEEEIVAATDSAEEEELIAETEVAEGDDNIVAESAVETDEVPKEELSATDQSEQSIQTEQLPDDDKATEASADEEQALEATTVDSDEYSDSDELDSKFGS